MRFLLLNQTFHPDCVATAQVLRSLAVELVRKGHQVTVVTGRRAYDDPAKLFQAYEEWEGIKIHRIGSTGLGKSAKWKRALDFASFLLVCCCKLLTLPRHDVVVALTSPPLISVLGAVYSKLRRARFFYWIMDLNPDEAIAAGWLNPKSLSAKLLEALSRFSMRHSEKVIALDRFMADRVAGKGISRHTILTLPPWSDDDHIVDDPSGRERFRTQHGLAGKFVVMYSGNHSPCHPLDTLLEAVKEIEVTSQRSFGFPRFPALFPAASSGSDSSLSAPTSSFQTPTTPCSLLPPDIAFLFVGGGSEFAKVKKFAKDHQLSNIVCLPYQPLSGLSASLSAADLHVVVMGHPFVGIIHPCKIYNILRIARPVLYIGPKASHVTDLRGLHGEQEAGSGSPNNKLNKKAILYHSAHGDAEGLVKNIFTAATAKPNDHKAEDADSAFAALAEQFSSKNLLPQLMAVLEANKPSKIGADGAA